MAESPLQEKLGEVLGLAQAAQAATKKVATLAKDEPQLRKVLEQMTDEARQTEEAVKEAAKASEDVVLKEVNATAKETKAEAQEMMKTYLGRGSDALDGLEFLTMAEAGELIHWEIVQTMNKTIKDKAVAAALKQVLPIQKRHVKDVRAQALELAADEAQEG